MKGRGGDAGVQVAYAFEPGMTTQKSERRAAEAYTAALYGTRTSFVQPCARNHVRTLGCGEGQIECECGGAEEAAGAQVRMRV